MLNAVMKKNGFSLIEVLIATVLVGIAIVSLLVASNSFTRANSDGTNLSIAEFLNEQIKELTALLPVIDPETGVTTFGPEEGSLANYDDLDDFDGTSFSPPINSNRQTLNNFPAFNQQVTVENVSATNFEQVVGDHGSSFIKVTVNVLYNSEQVTSASWVRARH